jgi:hypothetical protein
MQIAWGHAAGCTWTPIPPSESDTDPCTRRWQCVPGKRSAAVERGCMCVSLGKIGKKTQLNSGEGREGKLNGKGCEDRGRGVYWGKQGGRCEVVV